MKELEGVVLKCLDKDQSLRFQSAAELTQALAMIRDGQSLPEDVKYRQPNLVLTQWQLIGLITLAFICFQYTIFKRTSVYGANAGAQWLVINIVGASIFLPVAINRFGQLFRRNDRPEAWWRAIMGFSFGLANLFYIPTAIYATFFESGGRPDWLAVLMFPSLALQLVFLLLSVSAVLGFLIFRSAKRVGFAYVIARFIFTICLLAIVIFTVFGAQSAAMISGIGNTTFFYAGDTKKAMACWSLANRIHPVWHIYNRQADCELEQGNIDHAIAYYTEALKVIDSFDSSREELIGDRADAYMKKGEFQKAASDIEQMIKEYASSQGYEHLARLKVKQKDFNGAIEAYDEAIKLTQYPADCYHKQIDIYLSLGSYSQALELLDQAISHEDSIALRLVQFCVFEKLSQPEDAKRALEEAVEVGKKSDAFTSEKQKELNILLAYAYEKLGNDALSRKYLGKAEVAQYTHSDLSKALSLELSESLIKRR